MFTGLVQTVGTVEAREPLGDGLAFRVRAPGWAEALEPGESVAVDGVCQTVVEVEGETFGVQTIRTTLARTTLADYEAGRAVNLERALRAGDSVGGHFVQGHVDGVGRVVRVEPGDEMVRLGIALPSEVEEVTVVRGSLAVDGVSLTVAELSDGVAELAIIPYTWSHTSLSRLEEEGRVNLEADLIAKLVRKLASPHLEAGGRRRGEDRGRGGGLETPARGGD